MFTRGLQARRRGNPLASACKPTSWATMHLSMLDGLDLYSLRRGLRL